MPEAVSIQFTVGKLDAGIGILISPENHISMLNDILDRFSFFLVEFPSSMLPDKVHVGSILNLTIER